MAATVVVRDLHKRYGRVEAARGVSFDIQPGEIFGLLGPNGAGKTTTIECVIGLREPDAGEITVNGVDARARPHDVKAHIGAALQSTSLQDKITPREALVLFGSFYPRRADADTLLARFSLADKANVPFDTLSGGQKQRLALALAFVNRPDLVFLDEPTAGLDPQARHELHGEILRMKAEGHTVFLTTHYLDEAQALCDRLAIMSAGRIVASGRPADLLAASDARHRISLTVDRPIERAWLAGTSGAAAATIDGTRVELHTTAPAHDAAAILAAIDAAGAALVDLHVQRATLEDVFLQLTADART